MIKAIRNVKLIGVFALILSLTCWLFSEPGDESMVPIIRLSLSTIIGCWLFNYIFNSTKDEDHAGN